MIGGHMCLLTTGILVNSKWDHATPVLKTLQQLPIPLRVCHWMTVTLDALRDPFPIPPTVPHLCLTSLRACVTHHLPHSIPDTLVCVVPLTGQTHFSLRAFALAVSCTRRTFLSQENFSPSENFMVCCFISFKSFLTHATFRRNVPSHSV